MTTALSQAADRSTRSAAGASRNRLADLAAIAVIGVCALVLHRDGLFGGASFYELDTRLFYFPLAQWVSQQLHSSVFPLWLPGIFTGYPIFADGEVGMAYAPQLALLYLLPSELAMVWLRVLHAFLAGLFTYLYLRSLRLEPLPGLAGALVFAFGSFLTAQMHHENVVRSAVWLPAVLACVERAVQQPVPFRRGRMVMWTGLGALAFAQAAFGLHVQPVLMAALAVVLYAVFRSLTPVWGADVARRNAYWPLASGAGVLGGGLALAAVQWLPLGEWALVSSRRGGVDYEFASAFALPPANLLALVFPYFFRLPDATTWWSLWQQWEIELYVGIPTLALAILGIVLSRRIEVVYFVVLAGISLWIALAEYAPVFNLHQVLWAVPGFSFLRAPGRFTYLVVFAFACLAGFGLQVLAQRRLRIVVALLGAAPGVIALASALALMPGWRSWLLADSSRAVAWIDATYLDTRAQYPIDPALALSGMLSSLDPTTPKTLWSLALLALTSLAFVLWLELGWQRYRLSQSVFVGLLAIDLLVFASDFHPRLPLVSLTPDLTVGSGQRVLLHDSTDLPQFEPDQLLAEGIQTAGGYSSLPSQRHVEVEAATAVDPRLFDLWSAPFVLEPAAPSDMREANAVRFRFKHPIAAGFGGSPAQHLQIPAGIGRIAGLRVIGTLSYAFNVPQGQTVAALAVGEQSVPLRAGIELSERAFDRPSLRGLVRHQKAPVAFDFQEATPEGEDYTAHLYEADLTLSAPVSATALTFAPTDPSVLVEVYGLALVDAGGRVTSLDLADREGMQRVSDTVLANTRALPRAYLLPRTQGFSPARHAGLTATQLVASPDMDPHTMVLVENDPSAPASPEVSSPLPAAAAGSVEDVGPNVVRVTATAQAPSYLVLDDFYHRGWTARVDGQSTRVFIANALFRAVAVEAGTHVVEFRFEPLSHVIGAALSALSLLVIVGGIALGARHPR